MVMGAVLWFELVCAICIRKERALARHEGVKQRLS